MSRYMYIRFNVDIENTFRRMAIYTVAMQDIPSQVHVAMYTIRLGTTGVDNLPCYTVKLFM